MPSLNTFCNLQSAALKRFIKEEASNSDNLLHPDSDFSRSRRLPLSIWQPWPTRRKIARSTDLFPFFLILCPTFLYLPFPRADRKSGSCFISHVFYRMNDLFSSEDDKTFHGWRLLSVDGSELSVSPDGNDMSTYGGSKKGSKHHFYLANPLYDVLNHVYLDLVMQPGSQKNEDSAFLELAQRYEGEKAIFICDRGYEALMTFYRLNQTDKHFVIRIKDESSSTSILKHYPTPDTEEYDISFDVTLTCKNNSHVKANWETYKYISSYSKHPEFQNGVTELPLHGRAVRYKTVCEGIESFITLFTNLPFDEFTTEDLCEIYRLRWQIELSYRDIKRADWTEGCMDARRNWSLEKSSKMTLYNLYSRIRNKVENSQEFAERCRNAMKRKWEQKADYAFLITAVHAFLWDSGVYTADKLINLILHKTQSVRPGRADKRKKKR
ncbi:transposase [Allobaculum mucilyticum]|uniref:transposase n=1 Tax=Allobaculum mucilyticum TaxID=2834459 RepID=UPI001F600BDF|nr:transposase [Allobaculum mucilyticum]UNT95535.1 transposase [Allobaculum mucilyticum]